MEDGNFLKEKLKEEEIVKEIIEERMETEGGVKKPSRGYSFVRSWGGWLIGDE